MIASQELLARLKPSLAQLEEKRRACFAVVEDLDLNTRIWTKD